MKILGISGSLRKGSYNTMLLLVVKHYLPAEISYELADISKIDHYDEDIDGDTKPATVTTFLNKINESDILLISSPEYNHSMSGVLKNAIDWASRPAFQSPLLNKPVGLLTVSKSPVGGARAQSDLKNVLSSTLSFIYPSTEYLLPNAHEMFDANGELINEQAQQRLMRYVNGLIKWAGH